MDPVLTEAFGLDPDVLHLNHGAYGVAPGDVRRAAAIWRERAERNPHRFNRVELPGHVAAARERAAAFLGIDAGRAAWVRNVSEGVSAVLRSLALAPGDELVTSNHGYGAVRKALAYQAGRHGARVVEAAFPVGATDEQVVAAYAAALSPRTRLAVVDRITSPTATVLPAAAVAAAAARAGVPVLIDAAHAPGHLNDDIAGLGADYWVGNLHKWAYTPRGSAILWTRPGLQVTPAVLGWSLDQGYAASFDYPGTWDCAGWLAVPHGLAYWELLGGWEAVTRQAKTADAGQRVVASALDVTLDNLPAAPAPLMRLVPLPDGTVTDPGQADALYEDLSRRGAEVAVVFFGGAAYLRVATAPYNTPDDYARLARLARDAVKPANTARLRLVRRADGGRGPGPAGGGARRHPGR